NMRHGFRRMLGVFVLTVSTCAAAVVAAAPPASANTVIDTRSATNGTVSSFGLPDTSTYGETITVPPGESSIDSFVFQMLVPTQVQFRGAIYQWDAVNSHATGAPLWVGPTQSTPSGAQNDITFTTGGVPVVAGAQYVLFATASFDDGPAGTGSWRRGPDTNYSGGTFVFLNNGTNEGQLTTATWSTFFGIDLGFEVQFGVPVPTTTVAVTASTPTAVEGGANGAFTFTRSGDNSQSLTVGYNVSGTATPGTDYDPLGTVVIPAGQASATIPVHALADNVSDDGETVSVAVSDGAGYSAGSPRQATVTIHETAPAG